MRSTEGRVGEGWRKKEEREGEEEEVRRKAAILRPKGWLMYGKEVDS